MYKLGIKICESKHLQRVRSSDMAALQGQHAWSVCSCAGMGWVCEAECLATDWTPPFSGRGFVVLSASVSACGG
mgnify:CR=1 FL=1